MKEYERPTVITSDEAGFEAVYMASGDTGMHTIYCARAGKEIVPGSNIPGCSDCIVYYAEAFGATGYVTGNNYISSDNVAKFFADGGQCYAMRSDAPESW